MKVGFYAGSFSPFTNGHLQVVEKASKLFDKVVIGIGNNSQKTPRYDNEIMKKAIEKLLVRLELDKIVNVVIYDNLSVDAAIENGANILIRGIRNGMDYEYEENMASINEEISGLDTIYIRAGKLGNISSSLVVELMKNNKNVSEYLPKEIEEAIKNKDNN